MTEFMKAALIVTAAFCLFKPPALRAGGDLGDRAWDRTHEVPAGSTWQLSWVSPYAPYEIRGAYDLKIVRFYEDFEIVTPEVTDLEYNRSNCKICISALNKAKPTVLILAEGTRFEVFNDMIDFKLQEH